MICDERPVVTGGSSVGDGSFVVASLQSSKSVCSDKGGAVNGRRLLVIQLCREAGKREAHQTIDWISAKIQYQIE